MADNEFDMQTAISILERMQNDFLQNTSSGEVSAVEGTFAFDSLSANSIEFEKAYAEMSLMMDAAFPQTSWGIYLTRLAEAFGVIRKDATFATVVLTIDGNKGATVPAGSMFSTSDGIYFTTVEDAVIGEDGTAKVRAAAEDAGSIGNVSAGKITKIPISIYGVKSVTNEYAAYDGFDEESDDALRSRYLIKVRTPATSGNPYHYLEWALEVEGVGQAKVISLWDGPGTVKVIIIDADNKTASHELVQAAYEHIESKRPIGATVTVTSPEPYYINIELDMDGSVKPDVIRDAVNAFFRSNGFSAKKVTLAQIGRIIMNTELVNDYENLTLNGEAKSIAIGDEQLPVCGEVILHGID